MTTMTYQLISTKGRRTVTGTLAEAIRAAKAMDAELQPIHGVTVEDADGETVADVDDGAISPSTGLWARIDGLREESAVAGDIAQVAVCEAAQGADERTEAGQAAIRECIRVLADAEAQA